MIDPPRLLDDDATDTERALLSAAVSRRARKGSLQRTLVAIGTAGGAASTTATAAATASIVSAAGAKVGASVMLVAFVAAGARRASGRVGFAYHATHSSRSTSNRGRSRIRGVERDRSPCGSASPCAVTRTIVRCEHERIIAPPGGGGGRRRRPGAPCRRRRRSAHCARSLRARLSARHASSRSDGAPHRSPRRAR